MTSPEVSGASFHSGEKETTVLASTDCILAKFAKIMYFFDQLIIARLNSVFILLQIPEW